LFEKPNEKSDRKGSALSACEARRRSNLEVDVRAYLPCSQSFPVDRKLTLASFYLCEGQKIPFRHEARKTMYKNLNSVCVIRLRRSRQRLKTLCLLTSITWSLDCTALGHQLYPQYTILTFIKLRLPDRELEKCASYVPLDPPLAVFLKRVNI
jgi:hypothetical protein